MNFAEAMIDWTTSKVQIFNLYNRVFPLLGSIGKNKTNLFICKFTNYT